MYIDGTCWRGKKRRGREREREEGEVQLLKVIVGKVVVVVVVVEATRRNCTNEGTTRCQPGGSSRTGIASSRTTSTLFFDRYVEQHKD